MSNILRPSVRPFRRQLIGELIEGKRSPVIVKVEAGYGLSVKTEKGYVIVRPVMARRKDVEADAESKIGKAPKTKTVNLYA